MKYLADLQRFFHKYADEKKAAPMKRYMKDRFDFLGIQSTERRHYLKEFVTIYGWPAREKTEDVVVGLYSLPYREFHYTAIEIADRLIKKPMSDDIYAIEYLLEYNQWWDTIDFIATKPVARWMKNHPDKRLVYFFRWNNSNDLWLNRTAILFQLKYKGETDRNILSEAILTHSRSKEFFHQKAIGWALREYAKTNPQWVKDFVSNHELSKLSRREALKNLTI